MDTLKYIFKWFEWLLGLKVNYGKCEFIGIRLEDSHFASLANVFGYRVGKLPCKYLGLPLCLGLPKHQLWDPVVERKDKKFNSWKERYLSMGGLITLKKSVSAILIYFCSRFRSSKSVLPWIEKIKRDFLWNDSIAKRIYHLVRWEMVCKPGIRSIDKVNKALIGKWLWRLGQFGHCLWRQILLHEYKVGNDGWYVSSRFSKASGLLTFIL